MEKMAETICTLECKGTSFPPVVPSRLAECSEDKQWSNRVVYKDIFCFAAQLGHQQHIKFLSSPFLSLIFIWRRLAIRRIDTVCVWAIITPCSGWRPKEDIKSWFIFARTWLTYRKWDERIFFFLKKLSEIMDVFLCDLGTFWSVLSHQDQYYEGLVQICIS